MDAYTLYVIDDEFSITEGIKLALEASYRIRTFSEAESAINAIKKDPPDLILLDIGLPGMNGIETLDEIKALYADIIVIMITAYEDIETVISAMRLGAYDYVVKPLHMDSLKMSIKRPLKPLSCARKFKTFRPNTCRKTSRVSSGKAARSSMLWIL